VLHGGAKERAAGGLSSSRSYPMPSNAKDRKLDAHVRGALAGELEKEGATWQRAEEPAKAKAPNPHVNEDSGPSKKIRQRPTLPRGFPRSTIGSGGLNFRVRDGNGWDPSDIATGNWCDSYIQRVEFQFLLRSAFFRAGTTRLWSVLGASTLDSNPRTPPGFLVGPAKD
jgi:hypothetical protein